MGKKLLISIGTALYDNLPEDMQRPQLEKVVDSITQLFTGSLGYDRVLEEVGTNPTSNELSKTLDKWFSSRDRDPSDWIVLYYTGHGELSETKTLYLLTRDYESELLSSTAFCVSQLGDMLIGRDAFGKNRRVQHFLLILDTCHSGQGALEFSQKIRNLFEDGISGRMFYVLAAAFPNEEAIPGKFATALIESLNDEALGGSQQKVIYFDQLLPKINNKLVSHQVVYCPVASPKEEPQFFPNPRFIEGLPSSTTVEEIRQITESGELEVFWDPISRGVEFEQQVGWYFTGRNRVLQELSEWLNNSKSDDTKTRIVTGGAGSGKSAILSRIVTLSDPQYRQKIPRKHKNWNKAFPAQIINLAIHAKGKTLDEVIGRFATQLGVEPNRFQVFDALEKLQSPFHIVLDALDEAREPLRIAQELLAPLNSLSSVKLLVGTRSEYVEELGASAVQLKIDEPQYLEKSDLANYVKDRLLRRSEKAEKTPYKRKATLATEIAKAVADKAYPNFLIARLVSENLLASPQVIEPRLVEREDFPDNVGKAFEQYLSRYKDQEQKVRDLLIPLAWAEGLGLPWSNVWPSIASALSQRSYQDSDIHWLLQHAGSFVVESLEKNRSVYRLYHQALADYLRKGRDQKRVQHLIVEELLTTVPLLADNSGKDWLIASPYVLTHLAEHAAYCNKIAELVSDPFYLLAADPDRLMPLLRSHKNIIPRDIFNVYMLNVHQVREKPIGEAASYLEMSARQNELTELANRISQLPINRFWSLLWTHWQPSTPSQTFGSGDSVVSALATASWVSGQPVALIGRSDGSAEVWRIKDGTLLNRWKPDYHVENVLYLTLVESKYGWLLTVAWSSGHLGVFNVTRGEAVSIRFLDWGSYFSNSARISGLCVVNRNDQLICVTAQINSSLVIWELPNLNPILELYNATDSPIDCLHIVKCGSESFLLSGNDSIKKGHGNQILDDSMLRLWSLQDLSLLWEDKRQEKGYLTRLRSGIFFGKLLIISHNFIKSEIWDLDKHQVIFQIHSKTTRTWLYEFRGETFLINHWMGKLKIERATASSKGDELSLAFSLVNDNIPIQGSHFTDIFDLSGRPIFLSSVFGDIQIWDLEDLIAMASPLEKDLASNMVGEVGAMIALSQKLYLGTLDKIIALDATTGAVLWVKTIVENSNGIASLAVSSEKNYLVAGYDGFIQVFDIANQGSLLRSIDIGEQIEKLEVIEWEGRTLAFATVCTDRVWEVRIWDLQTGKNVTFDSQYRLNGGREDKTMYGLAVSKTSDSVRMAFASSYSEVIVIDVGNTNKINQVESYEILRVPISQIEYIYSLTADWVFDELLLAAGTEYGHLAIWDFISNELKSFCLNAHIGKIYVLDFHTLGKQTVLLSGGDDGILKFWSIDLSEIFSINIDTRINDFTWIGVDCLAVGTSKGVLTFKLNFI
jgi:WD40 repeat protein